MKVVYAFTLASMRLRSSVVTLLSIYAYSLPPLPTRLVLSPFPISSAEFPRPAFAIYPRTLASCIRRSPTAPIHTKENENSCAAYFEFFFG